MYVYKTGSKRCPLSWDEINEMFVESQGGEVLLPLAELRQRLQDRESLPIEIRGDFSFRSLIPELSRAQSLTIGLIRLVQAGVRHLEIQGAKFDFSEDDEIKATTLFLGVAEKNSLNIEQIALLGSRGNFSEIVEVRSQKKKKEGDAPPTRKTTELLESW